MPDFDFQIISVQSNWQYAQAERTGGMDRKNEMQK